MIAISLDPCQHALTAFSYSNGNFDEGAIRRIRNCPQLSLGIKIAVALIKLQDGLEIPIDDCLRVWERLTGRKEIKNLAIGKRGVALESYCPNDGRRLMGTPNKTRRTSGRRGIKKQQAGKKRESVDTGRHV